MESKHKYYVSWIPDIKQWHKKTQVIKLFIVDTICEYYVSLIVTWHKYYSSWVLSILCIMRSMNEYCIKYITGNLFLLMQLMFILYIHWTIYLPCAELKLHAFIKVVFCLVPHQYLSMHARWMNYLWYVNNTPDNERNYIVREE